MKHEMCGRPYPQGVADRGITVPRLTSRKYMVGTTSRWRWFAHFGWSIGYQRSCPSRGKPIKGHIVIGSVPNFRYGLSHTDVWSL
jgi:hypothetical protein